MPGHSHQTSQDQSQPAGIFLRQSALAAAFLPPTFLSVSHLLHVGEIASLRNPICRQFSVQVSLISILTKAASMVLGGFLTNSGYAVNGQRHR
jgi:hypothetical protein